MLLGGRLDDNVWTTRIRSRVQQLSEQSEGGDNNQPTIDVLDNEGANKVREWREKRRKENESENDGWGRQVPPVQPPSSSSTTAATTTIHPPRRRQL
jgi:hypothetical protein